MSDLGVSIIAHASGTPERASAIKTAAAKPELFSELDKRFPSGKASDQAIRSYLLTQKFIPIAADAAIRSYRETKDLVEAESVGYVANPNEAETTMETPEQDFSGLGPKPFPGMRHELDDPGPPLASVRKAVFVVPEGDVQVTFPEDLTPSSVQDLQDYINIWLRQIKREADTKYGEEAAN